MPLGFNQTSVGGNLNDGPEARCALIDPSANEDFQGALLSQTKLAPQLQFDARTYVLTGAFYFGKRKECQREIVARGGLCGESVTKKTDVLVIGELASRDWLHSSFGLKIKAPMDLCSQGRSIAIVSEEPWTKHL